MNTPYAILLVKPTDSDEVIRKAYHILARASHPDIVGTGPATRATWHRVTEAYNQVKTQELRDTLQKRSALLSGECVRCKGAGVTGTRMFKGTIKLCEECKGEGRLK